MANISLDIKANTQKALGEFKKLSRELDNKFLVQGLKLDVVKTAFRDITRQFDSAVSDQGFKAGETAAQLRNNLSTNLIALKRFGSDASIQLSKDLVGIASTLRAQGVIGAEAYTAALRDISFAEFGGTEAQRKEQFKKLTKEIAIFGQDTADVYGENIVPDLSKILKGQTSAADAFGVGSATTNLINKIIRDSGTGLSELSSISNVQRTKLLETIVDTFKQEETFIEGKADLEKTAPFLRIRREIEGLFEPTKGIFGALREITIGDETTSLVQEAAKLINSIFGRKGIFAILNKTLSDVFGNFDVLGVIIRGTKLLTSGLEKLGEFFGSETFKSFLEIFIPIQEAFEGVLASGFSFNPASINEFIDQIFASIRGLITNIGEFIKGIDGSKIGGIVSNLFDNLVDTVKVLFSTISELIKGIDAGQLGGVIAGALDSLTEILPSLISLLGTALGKAVEVAASTFAQSSGGTKLALGALGTGLIADNVTKFFTGGEGILGILKKAIIDRIPFIGGRIDKGKNVRAAKGSDQERWNLLYTKLDTIIEKLGGGGILDLLNNRRSPKTYRSGPRTRLRLPGSRDLNLLKSGRPTALPGTGGVPRLPGTGPRPRLPGVSPRNLTNVTPGGPRGGGGFGGPRGIGGQIVDVTAYAVDDVVGALPGASRGTSTVARIAPKILGAANVIGKIAAPLTLLIGGIRAFQTVTDKEKSEREKTRGVTQVGAGLAGGFAGGALGLKAGAAIGSLFGPGVGTAIGGGIGTLLGGLLGAVAGEEAVKALSDPIIDGITDFSKAIGGFFVDLWKGTGNFFSGWGKSIMNFFGKEGPIQKTGAFAKKLYEDLGGSISTTWDNITSTFKSITEWLKEKTGPFVDFLKGNTDGQGNPIEGERALGGAGRGLTLVGENGPELVNLGSGSVVTPQSSFAGLFGSGGGKGGVVNNIVVNINAPGAELFANEIANNIIEKLDEVYENEQALLVNTR